MKVVEEQYIRRYIVIDKNCRLVLILLLLTTLMIIGFLIEFYNLKQFKKCYNNNFKSKYCEKFKNY